MTKTFSIDPETERLAKELALARGQPVAAIVRDAIAASARAAGIAFKETGRLTPAEKRQRLLEISERSAARPILDPRLPDELLGYDEHGLPR